MKEETIERMAKPLGMVMGLVWVVGTFLLWRSDWIAGLGFMIVWGTLVITIPRILPNLVSDKISNL